MPDDFMTLCNHLGLIDHLEVPVRYPSLAEAVERVRELKLRLDLATGLVQHVLDSYQPAGPPIDLDAIKDFLRMTEL